MPARALSPWLRRRRFLETAADDSWDLQPCWCRLSHPMPCRDPEPELGFDCPRSLWQWSKENDRWKFHNVLGLSSSSDNINLYRFAMQGRERACNYSAKVLETPARAKLVLDPPCHINEPLIPSRCFSKQHKWVPGNQMFLNVCNVYQNDVGECDNSQIFRYTVWTLYIWRSQHCFKDEWIHLIKASAITRSETGTTFTQLRSDLNRQA